MPISGSLDCRRVSLIMKTIITVGQLKKLLCDESDDQIIVLSRDSEGNSFAPLLNIDHGLLIGDDIEGSEIYSEDLQQAVALAEVLAGEGRRVVVFWPH